MSSLVPVLVKLNDYTVICGLTERCEVADLVLREAHMVVYWDAETKGLPGLCSKGPGKGCRVSDPVDEWHIPKASIMYVVKMSDRAWHEVVAQPWG